MTAGHLLLQQLPVHNASARVGLSCSAVRARLGVFSKQTRTYLFKQMNKEIKYVKIQRI